MLLKACKMKGKDGWKKTETILVTVFLITMSITSFFIIDSSNASILYVESEDSLQDKINQSSDGDVIQINQSITLSNFIIINKSIILNGKTGSIIQINGCDYGFNITTSNVSINNLTLYNCSTAITVKNQTQTLDNITISNITITNCSLYGVYSYHTTQLNISSSTIITNTGSGIFLLNTSSTIIYNNTIEENPNTGLNITQLSNNNTIRNNSFINNSISINITNSKNNLIHNNTFLNCTESHTFDNSINRWNTSTHGNYWNDYTGTDHDDNDIGDSSYIISGGSNLDEKPLGFFLPIVDFSYAPITPTTGNTITFTDNSTDPNDEDNPNLSYFWNLGDGNTSQEESPTHSYSDNGIYNVSLNVTNAYQQWNSTNQTIIVSNLGPTSLFTYSPNPSIVNETITFTNECSDTDGAIVAYNWTFDDGYYLNTTEKTNPTHTYNQSREYNVKLNITDNDGYIDTYTQTVSVTFKPQANFTIDISNPSTSDIITLNDTSTDIDGSIASYNWSFGDETFSQNQNPTHSYSDDGSYTITLNVTDNKGAFNQTSKNIIITNTPPTANFSFTPQNPTDTQIITFTDNSIDIDGSISNCTWTFGDGTTSYSQNSTTHQYADNGTYTVTLNVTDDDGDTGEHSVNINVSNVGPTAGFTFEPSNPLVGEIIWFNDTSTDQDGTIGNWSWSFADDTVNYSQNTSHIYSNLKSYDVTLSVTDNDGNTSSITKHLILKERTIKPITTTCPAYYNLTDESDVTIQIKTSNSTNLSVSKYSERPSTVERNISEYINLEKYFEITLENQSLLEWINVSLFYDQNDLNDDIDESSLKIFYWNETTKEWIKVLNCSNNVSNTNGYSGFVNANLSHLTLFTLGGTLIQDETTPPTLPTLINSSNNSMFSIANPTLNISYNQIVPCFTASLNGTTLPVETSDNKTFSVFVNTDLKNGNYSLQLTLVNATLIRTDTIYFTIFVPVETSHSSRSVEIPLWAWYSFILFSGSLFLWYIEMKFHFLKRIIIHKKPLTAEGIKSASRPSQGFVKDTLLTLQQSIESIDKTLFGDYDPWVQTKADINQTMYNIDLFTEKPDAYVGIQQKLLTDDQNCKRIVKLLEKNDYTVELIKKKTKLTSDDLSNELTTLLKYGLIKEKEKDKFQLTVQAQKIMKEKK